MFAKAPVVREALPHLPGIRFSRWESISRAVNILCHSAGSKIRLGSKKAPLAGIVVTKFFVFLLCIGEEICMNALKIKTTLDFIQPIYSLTA